MNPSNTQFGMRENTASPRQHDSRVAVRYVAGQSARPSAPEEPDLPDPSTSPWQGSSVRYPNNAAHTAATGGRPSCDEPLLNVQQAAHFLVISVSTLYGWVWQRRIPFIKIGRALRFDMKDIKTFIEGNKHARR
jgi:excisionase family DNA binding protein